MKCPGQQDKTSRECIEENIKPWREENEKLKSELKAIRDRIEAVNFETLNKIYCNQAFVGTDDNCEQIWDYTNISIDVVLNEILDLIKQIGGVK